MINRPIRTSLLLFVPILACANAAASQRSFYTKPDIHGDTVVFTCEGDLWLVNIKSHAAARITSDIGTKTNAHFSPDGTQIAFDAQYDGQTDVYVMPTEGGPPKRLTYDSTGPSVLGWTKDGTKILFRSRRGTAVLGYRHLFTVSASGGQPTLIPVPQGEFGSFAKDGRLAYVPVSNEWANWFRYRASRADQVWLADLKGHFKRLTDTNAVDTTPVWIEDSIYFISERTGVQNLYRLDPNTKGVVAATHYQDLPARYPGTDGKRVVFQHGPGLAVYDPTTKQTTELSFDLNSDRLHSRDQRVRVAAYAKNPSIGPTGKRIALEARGQILTVATESGDLRVLENQPGSRAMLPAWSPDGKQVAFVSDRSGEYELWITDAVGAKPARKVTSDLKGNFYTPLWAPDGKTIAISDRANRILLIDPVSGKTDLVDKCDNVQAYDGTPPDFGFSPDSKLLTFHRIEDNWLSQVYLYDIATKKKVCVSSSNVNSQNPVFSTDGKFLLYLADSLLNPAMSDGTQKYTFDNLRRVYMVALSPDTASPFLPKIDEEGVAEKSAAKAGPVSFEGLSDRIIEVPLPPGRYQQVAAITGKLLLINWGSMPTMDEPPIGHGELQAFDLEKKSLATISAGVDSFKLSSDGKKMLLNRATSFAVADATGAPVAFAPVNLSLYSITVQPEKEWRQILEESWRIARDFFYDPNMNGVDWNAIHRKYEAILPLVGDRTDLSRLQKDLVAELNSGHAYVSNPTPGAPGVPMGFLGANFDAAGDAVKITRLFRGDGFSGNRSPLLEPGLKIKEGDYIVSIAGQPVRANQDIQALLIGTPGQVVALGINERPTQEGQRVVYVRPIPNEDSLRYTDWVQGRNEYVRVHGGDNFGYMHAPDMETKGVIGFTKGQFPNVLKEGMIYDFRYNGGGFVSSLLLENVAAKPQAWFRPRDANTWTRESWANIGYHVALCNEFAFSDGELVIETWKRMKLGPIVGKSTGGGEVGSGGGYSLIDGGLLYIPNYGAFADGKWIVEGSGATPDINVDQDPAAVMAGRDPQLDKAIEILKAEIAKHPITKPEHPPFPDRSGRGKG